MTRALPEGPLACGSSQTLDPQDWDEIRAQGHRMLDDMIDFLVPCETGKVNPGFMGWVHGGGSADRVKSSE